MGPEYRIDEAKEVRVEGKGIEDIISDPISSGYSQRPVMVSLGVLDHHLRDWAFRHLIEEAEPESEGQQKNQTEGEIYLTRNTSIVMFIIHVNIMYC